MLRILAVGYAAVLLALGTHPSHPERSSVGFLETVLHLTTEQAAAFRAFVDLAGNVAAFVPLGLLVTAAWRIRSLGMLSGLLVGGTCELVQLFEPGRVASLVDVATNTAGGALGAALFLLGASGRLRRFRASAEGWPTAAGSGATPSGVTAVLPGSNRRMRPGTVVRGAGNEDAAPTLEAAASR